MPGLVDIHTHLLPGIDDGPETLEESLEMARAAVEAGITTIAATPHLRSDFPGVHVEEIGDRCQALRQTLENEGIPLQVVSGAEVSLIWALDASDERLRWASYGQRGTDLLIETPSDSSMLEQLLYQIRARGYRITLGHPERSRSLKQTPERLEDLVDQGVLLQVNADALLAPKRNAARQLAEHLCREGMAHVLASDAHRGHAWRAVSVLPGAVDALSELVGGARAQWMASDAPGAIVSGARLPDPPEVEVARKSFWPLRSRR